MDKDLIGLDNTFLDKVNTLLNTLKQQDVYMVPISGLRTLEEQAKNWRKGRSSYEIQKKLYDLRKSNGSYLADIIEGVGPQMDPSTVTNAIPGFSWHNWGQALDCYVCHEGDEKRLIFQEEDPLFHSYALPRYQTYATEAIKIGLTPGYFFHMKDMPHIQLHKEEVPTLYSIQYVNNYFKKIYLQLNK